MQDPESECVQLPPLSDPSARINLAFCEPDPNHQTQWKTMDEWNRPVYGWIIINNVNHGIQFFKMDGTFYRELRLGGRSGDITSPGWLPFSPPMVETKEKSQLDLVIDALLNAKNEGYLQAFYNIVSIASGRKMQPVDLTYQQFLSSVTGRPLALANIGISLELAARSLANDPVSIPIQIGASLPDRLDYNHFVTYFNDEISPNTSLITRSTLDLVPSFTPVNQSNHTSDTDLETYESLRNAKLNIISALVDPFTAIRTFHDTLPSVSIQVPRWSVEEALAKIMTFLRADPMLLSGASIRVQPKEHELKVHETASKVGLSAPKIEEWNWLQPYVDKSSELGAQEKSASSEWNGYMSLDVAPKHSPPKDEQTPHTAIEGYLRVRRPPADAQDRSKG